MNDNEKLLASLVNAMQRGLQSGKLDITDMQYIQTNIDDMARAYLETQSKQLANSYYQGLNERVQIEERKINRDVKAMREEVSRLQKELTELQSNAKELKATKWVPIGASVVCLLGALISVPLVFMAVGSVWASLYNGLKSVVGFNWLLIVMVAVLGIVVAVVFVFIFAYLYMGFNWVYEKFFDKQDNNGW